MSLQTMSSRSASDRLTRSGPELGELLDIDSC